MGSLQLGKLQCRGGERGGDTGQGQGSRVKCGRSSRPGKGRKPLTGFPKKAAVGNRRNGKDGRAHTAGAEANTKPEVRSRVGEPF